MSGAQFLEAHGDYLKLVSGPPATALKIPRLFFLTMSGAPADPPRLKPSYSLLFICGGRNPRLPPFGFSADCKVAPFQNAALIIGSLKLTAGPSTSLRSAQDDSIFRFDSFERSEQSDGDCISCII
jgi:hypothetical protein